MGYPRKKRRRRKKPGKPLRNLVLFFALILLVLVVLYLVSPAREAHDQQIRALWASLRDQAALFQARLETLDLPTVPLPSPAQPTDVGELALFFAPVEALSPFGIDDHLVQFISDAESSVLAAFYELSLGSVADALIERHRAGVRVAIVSDSHYEDREGVLRCIAAGIPVVFDERSAFMHNKFCVVDGTRVWTGSTNVSENGVYRNNNNALRIVSPHLAENYTHEFREMFDARRFGRRSPRNTPHPEVVVGAVRIECYFAPEDDVEREVLSEIAAADTRIDFMAFSFTSDPIGKAMAARVAQGVRVRGLFEGRNVNDRYAEDDRLRDAGAEIYLDQNRYSMHHKVIVIDGETSVTGSYNFSKSAEKENDENLLIIHDAAIARQFTDEFERLLPR